MKHIVIVTTSYPTNSDGSEAAGSFVSDFAEKMSECFRVTVVAPGANSSSEHLNPTLSVVRYKSCQLPLSLLNPKNPLDWFDITRTVYSGRAALDKVVSNGQCDHILALWVLPCGYWAKLIGNKYKVPYSTWALGSDIWGLGKIYLVKQVLKNVLKNSQANYADGYLLKDSVESLSGRPCKFLPSTRSLNILKSKEIAREAPYKLAFLGRWHHNKGIDILMESLYQLRREDWERIGEIRIFGGGPLQSTVDFYSKRLHSRGLPVVVGGYLNKTEAVDLLLWADYLFIPSRVESIPVVFSDAMKCMCPVISTPVGDLPCLVRDHGVGELAKNVDVKSYTDSISSALRKSPKDFEGNMQKMSQKFSFDSILDTLKI